MTAPAPYSPHPFFPPHGRAGPVRPPSNAPRLHAIVALSVIGPVGGLCACFAFFMGVFLSDACHEPGDIACSAVYIWFQATASVPAVLAALVLAGIGLGRARRGGGHGPVIAAWIVWGGFCLLWWTLVGMAS